MVYDCTRPADRERGVAAAVETVQRADPVVFPTEAIYGIAADAFSADAVAALRRAKGGSNQDLPVLIGSKHTLDGLVWSVPPAGRDLVDAFWPGPLSLIVEHAPSLALGLGDTGGKIMVRMPLHPIALEVLRTTGPLAVTGANASGQPAPRTVEEAREQLGYAVPVYLDGGRCVIEERSSIVDLTGDRPILLREGAISMDRLREVAPEVGDPSDATPAG
ncbi:MAG TPA: L-threonylcarbamoyladenylate synthase [Micromonosporaceae bacterium]